MLVYATADLQNSDHGSKSFISKINCARFALARTDSIRSVSGSLLAKPPYRRASSVPMLLLAHSASLPHDSGIPTCLLYRWLISRGSL